MIERLEGFHDSLAHLERLDFSLSCSAQAMFQLIDLGLDALDRHGALFQSTQQAGAELLLIEGFATAVLLDDAWQH